MTKYGCKFEYYEKKIKIPNLRILYDYIHYKNSKREIINKMYWKNIDLFNYIDDDIQICIYDNFPDNFFYHVCSTTEFREKYAEQYINHTSQLKFLYLSLYNKEHIQEYIKKSNYENTNNYDELYIIMKNILDFCSESLSVKIINHAEKKYLEEPNINLCIFLILMTSELKYLYDGLEKYGHGLISYDDYKLLKRMLCDDDYHSLLYFIHGYFFSNIIREPVKSKIAFENNLLSDNKILSSYIDLYSNLYDGKNIFECKNCQKTITKDKICCNNQDLVNKNYECPICYESTDIFISPYICTSHLFHLKCLSRNHNFISECPICKQCLSDEYILIKCSATDCY